MSEQHHKQKIVWVTGASKGIGRSVALAYGHQGCKVILSARGRADLEKVAQEIEESGGKAIIAPLDVTDEKAAQKLLKDLSEKHLLPDISILNAGTYVRDHPLHFDISKAHQQMDVNFWGVMNCLVSLVSYLKVKGGKIGIVASVSGYRGLPRASFYGAGKAALINFAESAQPDYRRAGIDLKLINPGFIRTPLTDKNEFPMPFLMDVDKAAERIVKGMESRRFEITFPRRFTWMLKLLQRLPNACVLGVNRLMTRKAPKK